MQGKLNGSTTYVIEADGERVSRLRVVWTGDQIEIAGIQVLPDYQNRGIGTAVITGLIHEGTVKGLPTLLEVEKDNLHARRLHLRLGFEQQGETHDTFRMIAYLPLR